MRPLRGIIAALSVGIVLSTAGFVPGGFSPAPALAAGGDYFPETGHSLSGPIRESWMEHGGLWLFGYPISEPFVWSDAAGETVIAQYFERARLEYHPALDGTEYRVLGGRLGYDLAEDRLDEAPFRAQPQPSQPHEPVPSVNPLDCDFVAATSHSLCGVFQQWWEDEGGLAVFGYPISEPFNEDGYTVQYFERARFEHHPEHAGSRWEVALGHLGKQDARARGLLGTTPFAPVTRVVSTTRATTAVYDSPWGEQTGELSAGEIVRVAGGPSRDMYQVVGVSAEGWVAAGDLIWTSMSDPRKAKNASLESYDAALAARVRSAGMVSTVAIWDPLTNRMYSGGAGPPVGGASLSKALLLAAVLSEVQHGAIDLNDVRGSLTIMIEFSDDDAANDAWTLIGGQPGMKAFLSQAGITGFNVSDPWDWGTISATAPTWATFMGLLGSGQLLDREQTAFALGLLHNVIGEHRWGILTPGNDRLSIGKNGWFDDTDPESGEYTWRVNSAGIVDVADGPLGIAPQVVVVVTRYPGADGVEFGMSLATDVVERVAAVGGRRWASAQQSYPVVGPDGGVLQGGNPAPKSPAARGFGSVVAALARVW